MPLTIGQLIAKMSYPGLNNYARSIDWNNAPEALVVAVWQRYEVLLDHLDGTEAPFATPGFWNRMLGEEALGIESQATRDAAQPDPEPRVSDSLDGPVTPSNATAAPADPSQGDIDAPKEAEDPEFIEMDEEANTQIAAEPDDNVQVLPVDDNSDIGTGPADPAPDVPARSQSPLPGPSHRSPQPANDQIGGAYDEHIEMHEIENILVRRFGTRARGYEINFRNLDAIGNLHALLQRAIELAVQRTTRDANPNDLIGVQITAPGMKKPVLLPFRPKDQIDIQMIMHLLDSVAQSNANVKVDDNMSIRVTRVCPPRAGAKKRQKPIKSNMGAYLDSFERSVAKIENRDMLCVPRAIVTGIAFIERTESPEKRTRYETIRRGDNNRCTRQKREAQELATRAGIDQTRMCGPAEFELLQQAIPDRYRMSIWDTDSFLQVFRGPQPRQSTIYLWLSKDHCRLAKSMPAVFGNNSYCEHCDRGYDHKERHKCPAICSGCFNHPRCLPGVRVLCEDCHRTFVSQQCCDLHKQDFVEEGEKRLRINPICQKYRICPTCCTRLDKGHECGVVKCAICHASYKKGEDHACFIQKHKAKKQRDKKSLIFFDTETCQDRTISETEMGSTCEHFVNTAVMLKVCEDCIDNHEAQCHRCGTREEKFKTFFGNDALQQLCEAIFVGTNRGTCILAHNFKSFDGQFILKWLDSKNLEPPPKIVVRGLSILSLEQDGFLFRDTLNFMPFKLAAFSKAFDIPVEKGTFPHLFNKEENYDAILPQLPELKYYALETQSAKDRKQMAQWHKQENEKMRAEGRLWNFREEIERYCVMDVVVLAKASMKFRKSMMDQTGIDCFFESLTIAGVCNLHYRKNHLRPNQIALIPEGGYNRKDKQSVMAIKYLKWFAQSRDLAGQGQMIQHARNQGEFRIEGYKVDGLLRSLDGEDLRVVYEILGCCWHGCERCFAEREMVGPSGKTMGELLDRTLMRQHTIENAGYDMKVIWEHEIMAELRRNGEMRNFFKECKDVVGPLNPRDSFYGGRVCNLNLNYKCKDNEKIYYFDVCSLYPWCNSYGDYPIGAPTVITENFLRIDRDHRPYKGIVKCKVLPPRSLYHPVLPFKRDDEKLLFCLCRTCGYTMSPGPCQHTVEERALTGTWVTFELYEAIEDGYEVMEIYEVYHYPDWLKYDPDSKDPSTSLFGSYISWAIKLKVEASGYPPSVTTEAQKAEFRASYLENENIELDPEKIEYNASLRSMAKLMANSFWGKFGQRADSGSVQYFTNPAEFYAFIYDPTNEIQTIRICTDSKVAVTYKRDSDFIETKRHVSVVIAAITTCHARLKLLSYLRPLGRRALYCDTDSVIFVVNTDRVQDPTYYMPPVGNFLGQLTDELEDYGVGSYCVELIAAGPKVYSMCIWSTETQDYVYTLKIRGFSLDSEASKKLNFHTLKAQVQNFLETGDSTPIDVTYRRLGRQEDHTVTTFYQKKSYKIVSDKIVVKRSGETIPFGYIEVDE